MRRATLIPAMACLALGPDTVFASDWTALVVARSNAEFAESFDDAAHAWQAFDASGIPVVGTILDGTATDLSDATLGLSGAAGALIYYSGPGSTDGLAMREGDVDIDTLMATASRAGVTRLVLMIENCSADGSAPRFDVSEPSPASGLEVMVFTSATDATGCTPDLRLTGRLEEMARVGTVQDDMRAVLAGLPSRGSITGRIDITNTVTENQRNEDIAFLPDDVILLDDLDGEQSAAPVQVVLPVMTLDDEAASPDRAEPLITLAVLPAEQVVALPLVPGQPEPSIIVGTIEGLTDAAFTLDDSAQDESRALAFDDIQARRALRTSNPDLFDALLASGSFDPPDDQLAVALQTELQRLNCYTLRVDGDWGNGSRRALQAYLDRLDSVQVASLDPNVDLFRLILRNDDVACPVVAPAAAAAATRPATPTRTAPAQPTPPAAAQPAPTAPATEPTGGGFPGNFGGVFR